MGERKFFVGVFELVKLERYIGIALVLTIQGLISCRINRMKIAILPELLSLCICLIEQTFQRFVVKISKPILSILKSRRAIASLLSLFIVEDCKQGGC